MASFFVWGLLIAAVSWPDGAIAQSYPADCKPNPGGTLECAPLLPSPFNFVGGGCANYGNYRSEAAALDTYVSLDLPTLGGHCPVTQFDPQGYLPWSPPRSRASFVFGCGSQQNYYVPIISSGYDVENYLLYTVDYATNPPACTDMRPPYDVSPVGRYRSVYCPRGWTRYGSICYRNTLDPLKNAGRPCPACGNPINPGGGNKYQEEVDYSGTGSFPLKFVRYYNSARRIKDRDQTHFSEIGFFDLFGNSAFANLSIDQPESTFWVNRGVDSIGGNWTHMYLRALSVVTSSDATRSTPASVALTAVFAYRPDGRVLTFSFYGGQWTADPDVSDRVTSISGGYEYYAADTEEVETYDANGRLLSIRNRGGITQTLSYDTAGRLLGVSDPWGHSLTFSYEAAPGAFGAQYRISQMTDPSGGIYRYAYDTNNNLVSVTSPTGHARTYLYGNPAFTRGLTGVVDESNQRYSTYGYDSWGRANLTELANGANHVAITYSGLNATATDANGVIRTYAFSNRFGVASLNGITQPAAGGTGTVTSTLSRDTGGNIKSRTDFNGNRNCYAFDLTRNLETVRVEGLAPGKACPTNLAGYTPPAGTRERKISTSWHATYRLPTLVAEADRTTAYTYDASGNTLTRTVTDTSVIPNVSRTWTYTYNGYGQVLTEDGPRTDAVDVTTYTYYSCATGYQCGQLQTVTNALGQTTTYNTYNADGQPLTVTDPNGVVTTLTYDLRQRLTSRSVGNETTTLEYWPTGLLKKVALPDGSFTLNTYDAAHRLVKVEDNLGNRIEYTLDAMGNRTAENVHDPSNALTRTHTRVYNTLNQLWKDVDAAGTAAVTTTYSYDNNGNQTSIAAPLSRTTGQVYDELNRLIQLTDPANGVTRFAYDVNDNLTAVTDPRNLVTNYQYNGFGDLTQLTSPDTGVTASTYDSGGNLATSTDARNRTATYTYDALNRVTTLAYGDRTFTYSYGAAPFPWTGCCLSPVIFSSCCFAHLTRQ